MICGVGTVQSVRILKLDILWVEGSRTYCISLAKFLPSIMISRGSNCNLNWFFWSIGLDVGWAFFESWQRNIGKLWSTPYLFVSLSMMIYCFVCKYTWGMALLTPTTMGRWVWFQFNSHGECASHLPMRAHTHTQTMGNAMVEYIPWYLMWLLNGRSNHSGRWCWNRKWKTNPYS